MVESYVAWVGPAYSDAALMANLTRAGGNSPESIFDHAYHSMNVTRFGRLGRFDYLSLLGLSRVGLQIRPGRAT